MAPRRSRRPWRKRKAFESIFCLRPDDDSILARAHQIAHRFIRVIGHIDRPQFAGAMQPGERETSAPVRFHPIAAPFRYHRRTHDHAGFPPLRQVPIDSEAARPGLVDNTNMLRVPMTYLLVCGSV
jgi:hypothetical protein